MTYTPTVWADYGVPWILAAPLNNMEEGIDRAQGDVMNRYGPTAALPASDATLVGRLYFESDLLRRVWRDNGAGWDLVLVGGWSAPLLVTGQTTQYGGYPDDGFYEWGAAKDYTVLTLGQYAGVTVITLNAKNENHSNNCVQDNETGLMWSRTVSGPNVGPANNGLLPWTTNGAGEGIYSYVAAANAAGLAGYADWRIPNDVEALSLLIQEAGRTVDLAAFPGFPVTRLWTSTTVPTNVTWAVTLRTDWGGNSPLYGQLKTSTWVVPLVRN